MTEQQFRITIGAIAIGATTIMVVVLLTAMATTPPLKMLHLMPAGELVVDAAINEGCTASDCCAH